MQGAQYLNLWLKHERVIEEGKTRKILLNTRQRGVANRSVCCDT